MKKFRNTSFAALLLLVTLSFGSCTSDDTSSDEGGGGGGSACSLEKEARDVAAAGEKFSLNPTASNCNAYKKVYQAFVNKANGCTELTQSMKSLLQANQTIQSMDCNDL
ncbi:hypothetical protein [Flavobacterium sp. JP2137]|uniref:hypothetical protein n=1 Tax=Flavobacterium sp. JP2137 TaxID=3414510 RepID=UPI003D2FD6A0